MPNTREKLIELLGQVQDEARKKRGYGTFCFGNEKVVDHLIANGVTVQQWIPVAERLPEGFETVLAYDGYSVEPSVFNEDIGFHECDKYEAYPLFGVTHWMPLPQPPKGE